MKLSYDCIHIRFLDHSEGTPENAGLVVCDVFGILSKEDRHAYYVTSWISHNNLEDQNCVVFTISKSDILSFTKIKPGRPTYPNGKKLFNEFQGE